MTLPLPSAPALDPAGPGREFWFRLPAQRTSARSARDLVRDQLRAWEIPGDTCCDAVLLVSELTSNAVLHSGGGRVLCGLSLTDDERCLRLELHDEGPAPVTLREHRAGPCEESGRGLFLVQQLADRWGATASTRTRGTAVWAELTVFP